MNISNKYCTTELYKIFILAWLVFYIGLSQIDLSAISETMNADSENILKLIQSKNNTKITDKTDNAYLNTARFFSYIPAPILQPFILLLGCIVLILFMKDLKGLKSLLIAAFLSLPAILLILIRPQKETIVVLLTIAVVRIFMGNFSMWIKITLSLCLYAIYGYFFRQYYFLIMLVFSGLLFFIYNNNMVRITLIIVLPILFMMVPGRLLMEVQGARDNVNFLRIYLGEAGSRTAFMNPLYPDTPLNFLGNYIYAFFRLNFAPFFYPGIRELFLMAIISLYGYLIYISVKSRNNIAILCSCLIVAHIIVYCIFEPDLGSYLRHVSSTMLYLVPMLALLDKRLKNI